ncbi:hypothetical protein [Intestinimonas massiliensis (ex Afouda et al. 2020)]|uniref:hypothetical protein n=1 Tax=Intestinimonas massiliensis (ex Afouda et al. 2020) TaxID=1673721 RepID=UPI0012B5ABED|nr:hypothetical protein [Intestinimonas massiliensis (ex Afouda et al. 2020)]
MVFFIAMNLCFLSGFGRLPAHSLCLCKSRAKVRSKERESLQSLLPLSNFFVWITLGLWKDSKTSGENFHHSFLKTQAKNPAFLMSLRQTDSLIFGQGAQETAAKSNGEKNHLGGDKVHRLSGCASSISYCLRFLTRVE